MQYNQLGNIVVASKVAYFCLATLYLTTELSLGLGEGVIQGIKNTGHMLSNPVETVCNMAHGVGLLAKGLIEVIKFDCDVFYYQVSGQSELANARIDEMNARISAVASAIATQCRELSARDIGRGIGTFSTEMILQQKLFTAFGKFFKFTKTQMAQLAQEFAKDERLLFTTAEGIQVHVADNIAREIAQAQNLHLQDAQRALDKGKAAVKVVQAEGAATAGVKAAQVEKKIVKISNQVVDNIRSGSALKKDIYHAFTDIIDNYASHAQRFKLRGGDGILRELYQIEGSLDGISGVFEWIVDPRQGKGVTHRFFVKNGTITGIPNMW